MAKANSTGASAPELPQHPFIDTDDSFTEAERLQTTVYNAVNVFALLEKLFADPPDGDQHISFGLEEYTGLQRIIAGAKSALNYAAGQIDDLETKQRNSGRALSANFSRLSPEQRELIEYLVSDIADGEVNPLNVATRDSARIVLARLEAESETLSDEECAAELDKYEFDTRHDFSGGYTVSHTWTLKGLRHVLAREKLFESITCNVASESHTDSK